ncbi:alkanesulfonate monooxygenase SsuD/methylene tetrahydromethanopterin reductase-like flavin-dependent oxidoreductase (luciferase family) [Kibdelosporangium banguiense]|uniref:Alkanesulfonate monooxygenase SsuD/methylene tetrahydromethanopterin reductase-like flavin-dependent oxidoreductase (Luciferase family) n=1 Tax=Kibdelosporangium banguiense TaxID=1365924 RepID=A0ABS4TW99_9PSEU|nr:LLM class flavin-dependent oxidoreductase [Kibdelosporangium banguiense]MBP2328254.1 alkanesulfonate monooxygenase SsuD/methylene tetrahydromethanopterin reductase-like flavin-dependent oxidoreductase (luciferase family) [Kibdelosporangium banguiense]
MKIGIGLPNQVRDVRPQVIPEWAARAEDAGFSTLGTVGRMAYPGVMDTVALAAAAGATKSIGLISNILIATAWPATLLAKEIAAIDGVSGGRLTLGIGVGLRSDDFVVDGLGTAGRGHRMDAALETYRDVWNGAPVGGGDNPAVTPDTRQVPLLFGGMSPAAYARMARWGQGYIAGSVPAAMAGQFFDAARAAWQQEGRDGAPRLVAIAYFALTDPDTGRRKVGDYYANTGEFTEMVVNSMSATPDEVRSTVKAFHDLGVDELVLNPTTDELDDIGRLADIVL